MMILKAMKYSLLLFYQSFISTLWSNLRITASPSGSTQANKRN